METLLNIFCVLWPHDCLCNVSKILAEFSKVFNFEKSLIYALPKFNSNLLENLLNIFCVLWPHDCLCNVSKILAEFSKVFNFEKSLIYALPKFNSNLMSAGCYLYFSIGNLTQNVY